MMKKYITNLYKLNNLSEIDFSYKLVGVDLSYLNHDPKEMHKCIEKVKQQIGSNIKGPVASLVLDNKRFIVIPSKSNLTIDKVHAYSLGVPLIKLNDVYQASIDNPEHKEIIYKLLDFELRKHLKEKHQLWTLNAFQFYLTKPVFTSEDSDVEMYGGFVYQLVEDNNDYFVCINPTYKYLSKNYLSDIISLSNHEDLIKHIRGKYFLYQNGDKWYQVEAKSFGRPICEHEFVDKFGKSHIVKDYILEKTKYHKFKVDNLLKNEHMALLYVYPGSDMKPQSGATSLAKRIFNTEEHEVKELHRKAILSPQKRFGLINNINTKFLQDFEWNGKKIPISSNSTEENLHSFLIPELKYNNNKILSLSRNSKYNSTAAIKDFGFKRKNWIKENQIFTNSPFTLQYLIVPNSADPTFVKEFKKHAEQYLKKLSSNFIGFELITYNSKITGSATEQVNNIAKELKLKGITTGNALFLLPFDNNTPNRRIKNFHNCLKKKFFPAIKFQCASISKIRTFYNCFSGSNSELHYSIKMGTIDKYKSYLFNLLMEYLIVNRKWPFILNKSLNYDIYIGIDVHERYAGFSFFYKNGEHLVFQHKEIPKTSGDKRNRAEKLKIDDIVPVLLEKLEEHIPIYAPYPNGIIIIRDGRSFGQEEIALKKVIESLNEKRLLNIDSFSWGVLDLHKKTSLPLRVATNNYNKLYNPSAGTYKVISSTNSLNGYIFNTGYPFGIKGTANPLHISLKAGNIDFTKALEDIFDQTILAYSAPDKPSSLPICIKLIDSYLAPVAANFQDIDDEEIAAIYEAEN